MRFKRISIIAPVITAAVMLFSCENNIQVVNALADPANLPTVSGDQVEIVYSDSARVKVKIVAPVLNGFHQGERSEYYEFPKGIHVYFYDDSLNVKAEVMAKYAIYTLEKKLWEARNNVVVINTRGERLNTEQLFWDENKKIIYSRIYSRITTPTGFHSGDNGFQANEDFSNWVFFGASGKINFEDETN